MLLRVARRQPGEGVYCIVTVNQAYQACNTCYNGGLMDYTGLRRQ